ncbi:MAG TPA: glycosyltransferase family 39 protein [Candidatus Tumulicola sp.]|nr:glycosyltransferase family 39 protein [Candidatus Tumulicola sp.]
MRLLQAQAPSPSTIQPGAPGAAACCSAPFTFRIPAIAAAVTLAVHLAANPHYGFYQDELYFIVCGFHPAWGYVDQPPLVPLLSAASQLFGTSLFALRALAACFAAGGVYVACLCAAQLGGGRFALWLTAALTACTPVLAAFGTKVSTDMPGLLLWPLAALLIARALAGNSRAWLGAGIALGIAAEAKYTVLLYGTALAVGVALGPARRALATRWALYGALAAALIALPSLGWQAAHGFPIVQMVANQQRDTLADRGLLQALAQQIVVTNPFLAPFWIAGLAFALRRASLRWIAMASLLTIVVLAASHGRNYYAGNVYPLLLAAGAVACERALRKLGKRLFSIVYVAAAALPTIPFVLPILPAPALAHVVAKARRAVPIRVSPERHRDAPLTDNFAGMLGWPQLAADVARVYRSLPPQQRAHAAIFAKNFAEASAIDVYGKRYGLPPAISGQNAYWTWGPRGYDGRVLIDVNGTCGPAFARRRVAVARAHDRWAMLAERDAPISVCYGLREPIARYWPSVKTYL